MELADEHPWGVLAQGSGAAVTPETQAAPRGTRRCPADWRRATSSPQSGGPRGPFGTP